MKEDNFRENILTFLNTDFEKLNPESPLEWLELYNTYFPQNSISENDYYEIFQKENILKYFEELFENFENLQTEDAQSILKLKSNELPLVYFNFIQQRLRKIILKVIKTNPTSWETAYPTSAPITPDKLGSKKIKVCNKINFNINLKTINPKRYIIEVWEKKPDNFEVLIWRIYYQFIREEFGTFLKFRCCKSCSLFFIYKDKRQALCDQKKCKNLRREKLREQRFQESLT